ncbi:aminotransferase class IV [Calothrix sp. 336/3]|uniref:aminotransferase class IV n=1 Tax=Calothrix sp. 336/3 TaxID=1337936 RepID=UPI0004E2DD88|nr:aminotransferase class IV [Calothrix sp. 336/3]AKG22831.1 4-amino-4-deoxychorismate lyase [Calothrix sp. 336/3]
MGNSATTTLSSIYWLDGQLIHSATLHISIDDPGLLYGATIFTTLRVYENSLKSSFTQWEAHCDRLKFSLTSFAWQTPNWANVRAGAEALSNYFPVLRITLFPDGREFITGRSLPPDLPNQQFSGITASIPSLEFTRSLPHHKTGNYLSSWLAKNEAKNLAAQEAILVNSQGNWLETSTGNLWGWGQGDWFTPPITEGILPGVGRSRIIQHLNQQQIPVNQHPWTPEIIAKIEALAYSNCVVEFIPIRQVIHPQGKLEYNPYHPCLEQIRGLFHHS